MTEIIKPKRLTDNPIHIWKDCVVLDFHITEVVFFGDFQYDGYSFPQKDWFQETYENSYQNIGTRYSMSDLKNLKWNRITITKEENNLFSSFANAGEDDFLVGSLNFSKDKFEIENMGFYYYAKYNTCLSCDFEISTLFDYNALYFLYQLFRDITSGKKIKNLLIYKNKRTFITDENFSFFIVIDSDKLKYQKEIADKFKMILVNDKNPKDIIKKELQLDNSTLKNLIRPLGDVAKQTNISSICKFSSEGYELYVTGTK